jgi:hypothetical protein
MSQTTKQELFLLKTAEEYVFVPQVQICMHCIIVVETTVIQCIKCKPAKRYKQYKIYKRHLHFVVPL